MNRLNSVVIKLWLTIILIVATVLILLSVSLITFIQYYFTQETENSIKEDAKRISSLVEIKNKSLAIQNSQKLIDGPGGLIIMKDFNDKPASSYNNTKIQMLKEIKHNDNFKKVFQKVNLKLKMSL